MAASQTWLIVGASSIISRAFAAEVAARGHKAILAGRDTDDIGATAADLRVRFGVPAVVLPINVTAPGTQADFVASCRAEAEGVLNVFIAVGSMPTQAAIDRDPGLAQSVIDTNLTGVAHLLQAFIPLFEAERKGSIVVLGSVAGDRGRPKNYVYGAAKAGLHAYLQGLRARLARVGVVVTTVKPGFVDTAMSYGQPGMFLVARPETVARDCLRAAERRTAVLYTPWFWKYIMWIIRAIPELIFKRLDI
jgi:short-subunit dehydrogenase